LKKKNAWLELLANSEPEKKGGGEELLSVKGSKIKYKIKKIK